ncbi:MAG: cyclophilin [Betaproteobacteria bacterium HGW-Betaproteobacteria-1]|jgi:cyclophilin family peptidyl-prolyl cis-trans isomerase|nr:MAG: cyclophilin [Betaproteobacteria bacterium HGW-Betaproteobacteria-1]
MRTKLHIFILACLLSFTAHAEPTVQINTSLGPIVVELDSAKAPKTVENFLGYVKSGHYNGTIFHRTIRRFMIQGGGMTADMKEKPTGPSIQNEADNGLKNLTGTIAMARTADPHSASAQFFINVADNAFLDHKSRDEKGWGYAVFGKVTSGMELVEKISRAPVWPGDVPTQPVVIESIELK